MKVSGLQTMRPRIIATTDGEVDDRCSMVRFLLYANEWEIEGLVYCSSRFHWKGHDWAGEKWIEEDIEQYAECYDRLRWHDPSYPTPDALRERVCIGNIDAAGEMGRDTPGSDRIVEILLDDKPGPVYLQAWGGTNTIARALWKIENEHPDRVNHVSKKAIIYVILDQDDTLREYIRPHWPDVQVLVSFEQFGCIAYYWRKNIPERLHTYFDAKWMTDNILEGHGPLCGGYEVGEGWVERELAEGEERCFRSEGDSPSFMHQIDVGLRSLEHPSYGGWGGRFEREKGAGNVWKDARELDDGDKPHQAIWRWAEAFQNDWAARADWCVKGYEDANHPPVVALAHEQDLTAVPGDTVALSASGSRDPDGDTLTCRWWQYREPGSYPGVVDIETTGPLQASFKVPDDAAPGQSVHIICEVTDNGVPPLTRYRRVIVAFQ